MARTRIILGHLPDSSLHLVYAGLSGSEAEAAMKDNVTATRFEIFEGPGRRKHNSAFDPAATPPAAASAPQPITIPDDIAGLKKPQLATALTAAIARIKELESQLEAAHKEQTEQPPQGSGDEGGDESDPP
jgi:hypothetical protein